MKQNPSFFHRIFLMVLVLAFAFSIPGSSTLAAPAGKSSLQSYIVQGTSTDLADQLVRQMGGSVSARLEIIQGVTAWLTPEAAGRLQQTVGIRSVTANSPIEMVGDGPDKGRGGQRSDIPATDYPNLTGANLVWSEGDLGSGVTVAILDTGIGEQQGVTRSVSRKTRIVGWADMISGRKAPYDDNGHGTHIAGIIANSQVGSDGEWGGMAPDVQLVGVRVLDKNGVGTYDTVTQAWAHGITVVAAAGNSGPGAMSIGVPGNNPYVITVGAFTDNYTPSDWSDDYITPFSSAGPTLDGFAKPDVVAPGAHMVSTMLPSTQIAKKHEANQVSNQYFSMAGTSQAAAVVSGMVSLILSRHPSLTPDEVKYRVMFTAMPWLNPETSDATYSIWQQGSGRVNVPDAVYADIEGRANQGMDIQADLAGDQHYEGFSYYDTEAGEFRLRVDYTSLANGFGAWSGGFGAWSGGFGAWSGGFGAWSGTEPWAGTLYADPVFVNDFLSGESADTKQVSAWVGDWVEEP